MRNKSIDSLLQVGKESLNTPRLFSMGLSECHFERTNHKEKASQVKGQAGSSEGDRIQGSVYYFLSRVNVQPFRTSPEFTTCIILG
jgi:YHS domain-containing protein